MKKIDVYCLYAPLYNYLETEFAFNFEKLKLAICVHS